MTGICLLILLCRKFVPGCTRLARARLNAAHLLRPKGTLGQAQTTLFSQLPLASFPALLLLEPSAASSAAAGAGAASSAAASTAAASAAAGAAGGGVGELVASAVASASALESPPPPPSSPSPSVGGVGGDALEIALERR